MPNKLIIGAVGIILVIVGTAWFSYEAGADGVRSDMAEVVKKAVAKARKNERIKQEKVNDIAQEQYDKITGINDRLNSDLNKLRERTSRGHLPDKSKAQCKGVTGESLSAEDSRFLTREAARADRLRTALKACYSYADTIN